MFKLQPSEDHNPITNHGLPTTPPSACFIHVTVGDDPREFYIPLGIAEAWGLSQGQILTPKLATKLSRAVERYRVRQQARRQRKAGGWLSEWYEREWRGSRVGSWPGLILILGAFLFCLSGLAFVLTVVGQEITRWITE